MASNATPKQKNQILMLVILLLLLTSGGMFVLFLKMNTDLSISAENASMLSRRIEQLEARAQKANVIVPEVQAPPKKLIIEDLTKSFSLALGETKTVKYSIGPADEYGDITLVSYTNGTKPQAIFTLQKREVVPGQEEKLSASVTDTARKIGDAITSGELSFGVVSFDSSGVVVMPGVALY